MKYDMRANPVYQVDCQIAANGKRIAATKRRVRFRFGFSNAESIAMGLTGTECRGEEHEVVMVWSLTSGKQFVLADGVEVYFQTSRWSDRLECSWTMKGGHEVKVLAYAAPPLFATPGFRQYDMFIDGLSFWEMPKIFQLGKTRAVVPSRARSNQVYNNYSVEPVAHFSRPPEQGFHSSAPFLQAEQKPSIESEPVPARRANSLPKDMLSVAAHDLLDASPSAEDYLDNTSILSPTSVMIMDEFTPVPYQPKPVQNSFQEQTNQIMSRYSPPAQNNALPALANESHTNRQHHPHVETNFGSYAPQQAMVTPDSYYGAFVTPTYGNGLQQFQYEHVGAQYRETPVIQTPPTPAFTSPSALSMEPLKIEDLDNSPDEDKSPMEKILKDLVNFDDISKPKETPEARKAKEQKEANKPARSKPLPPSKGEWYVGSNAPLGEIQAHKSPQKPTKEVMRVHAFDPQAVHAGMMVVYGAPQQSIPACQGFGAGAYYTQYNAQYPQQPVFACR